MRVLVHQADCDRQASIADSCGRCLRDSSLCVLGGHGSAIVQPRECWPDVREPRPHVVAAACGRGAPSSCAGDAVVLPAWSRVVGAAYEIAVAVVAPQCRTSNRAAPSILVACGQCRRAGCGRCRRAGCGRRCGRRAGRLLRAYTAGDLQTCRHILLVWPSPGVAGHISSW
jgi:hypothetical protein